MNVNSVLAILRMSLYSEFSVVFGLTDLDLPELRRKRF